MNKLLLLILGAVMIVLLAAGCRQQKPAAPPPLSPEDLTGFSMTRGDMVRTACCSFSLYRKDGIVLLDARYFEEDETETVLSGASVEPESFEDLVKLLTDRDLFSYWANTEKDEVLPEVQDAVTLTFELRYGDQRVTASDANGCEQELEAFFRRLAGEASAK